MIRLEKLTLSVPRVEAVSPRQVSDVDERREQVEQRPGDDDVVVDAHQAVDYQLTKPDTCTPS